MSTLPLDTYQVKQIRELESLAIEHGISEATLMARAGRATFEIIEIHFNDCRDVIVLCGGGNNGGDGYVVAKLLKQAGLEVRVIHTTSPEQLKGVAFEAAQDAIKAGVPCETWSADMDLDTDLIVDALLGIGLTGEVREPIASLIHQVNEAPAYVLSVDVPSGIDADTGNILGTAILADQTITFIGTKQGMLTGPAKNACGDIIHTDPLDIPDELFSDVLVSALCTELPEVHLLFEPREANCHKGDFGHVLVIGGDYGMPGAVRLAAEGAARMGAGLVSVATRPEHVSAIVSGRPECMCYGVQTEKELSPLLERATTLVVGPGLGTSDWSKALYACASATALPKVVDASALTFLADDPNPDPHRVITPHPGEAAKLLNQTVAGIQGNRFASVAALQASYDGVALLKGAGTLIQAADQLPEICTAGNPGMACGGMGDLLSGLIAGLLAQDFSLFDAARSGALIHAMAADRVSLREGQRGMLAMDLLPYIRQLINPWTLLP